MSFQIKTASVVLSFSTIFALGLSVVPTGAEARSRHIITLGSPVFHQDIKELRRQRARKSRRYIRRRGHFSRIPFTTEDRSSFIQRATRLKPPRRCYFTWVHTQSGGYRKIVCKRSYRARFPAVRPWAYRHFRKTAGNRCAAMTSSAACH